jgi:hypothetical protein
MTHQLNDHVIFETRVTAEDLLAHVNYMRDEDELHLVAISNDLIAILQSRLSDAVMREIQEFIVDFVEN